MSSFYSSRRSNLKASWFYMTYITINFILGSIGNATNTLLADQAFVDEPNRFPSGPSAFVAKIDTLLVTQISFIAYTINTWSQDGLLVSVQIYSGAELSSTKDKPSVEKNNRTSCIGFM